MPPTEPSGQSRRVEQMRPVEVSPGVTVYRAGSIVDRLVVEGTKVESQVSLTPATGRSDREVVA